MEEIKKLTKIAQANALVGKETLHPLVTVIDFSKHGSMEYLKMNMGFYGIFLKDIKDADVVYGRYNYDYQEGTLLFMSPNQVVGFGNRAEGEVFQPSGWALMFHADLLHGTSLGKHIKEYNYFSYEVHEALHISEQEKQIVLDSFQKIDMELQRGIDKHSKILIVSNIELFLNYCIRFYDRQFIIREHINRGILTKFDTLLNEYIQSGKAQDLGFPSVAYCATELNLSANYFGDLIKKEIGISAQEYVQTKLIEEAKERIFDPSKSVSEIAYELGFKYPQHFTRLFKQKVGVTPNEYRNAI